MARTVETTLLAILVVLLFSLVYGHSISGPKQLTLYVHEDRVPPGNTLIVSAAPSGNTSGVDEFGLIRTFSNLLRAGTSNTSAVVGTQVGIVVVGKDAVEVYISFTYRLNFTYKGSVAVQGHIRNTDTETLLAVTGGTGDFFGATGSDTGPVVPNPAAPSDEVFAHVLQLGYWSSSV